MYIEARYDRFYGSEARIGNSNRRTTYITNRRRVRLIDLTPSWAVFFASGLVSHQTPLADI
jgi:hypothetical protein